MRSKNYTLINFMSKTHMPIQSNTFSNMRDQMPNFTDITMAAPSTSQKTNIKQATILKEGKPFRMILGSADKPLRVPFDIRPYSPGDTSTRLNLNLALPDTNYEQYFSELDKHI